LEEIAAGDLYDLQERYVLLFDRTRSLSLHLFEHVHGESRDRGQAMVDLKALYERHGLTMSANELPDHLPLFLEFLSQITEAEAQELLEETAHVLEAIRLRLKKRKVAYSSVFSCAQALAKARPQPEILAALMGEPDEDPNDLAALDAAWEEEEVTFGPAAATAAQCGKDGLAAKLRAARRPAPGMAVPEPKRPVVTYTPSNRA
jgi:nitrate reductase delta subunit